MSIPRVFTHIRPNYSGHLIGTYARVGWCRSCGRVSLYEDFHPVDPCPSCGASNSQREWVSAKWVWDSPWWHLFWRKGRWKKAEEIKQEAAGHEQ